MRVLGSGTCEKRGVGKYRLRATVEMPSGEKNRLSKNIEARTKTEAKRELADWIHELKHDSNDFEKSLQPLAEYLRDYVNELEENGGYSPTTIGGYRKIIRTRFLNTHIGRMALEAIKPSDVNDHYSYLRREGGLKGKPLSGPTVMRAHSLLNSALNKAVVLEIIPKNPCFNLAPSGISQFEAHILDYSETRRMIALLNNHPDKRFGAAAALAYATGMRRGEVCGLAWQDVDLEANEISIRHSLVEINTENGTKLILKGPKSEASERVISIDQSTAKWLCLFKEEQKRALAYYGTKLDDITPVFCNSFGESYSPNHFSKDFQAFRDTHGFNIRLHDLRHSHASHLLNENADVIPVSRRMGHSKASTSQNMYGHTLPGRDRELAIQIGKIIDEALSA